MTRAGRARQARTVRGNAKRVAGLELNGELNREDFGLTWNVALEAGGVLVSKKIKLHIAVEVAEAAAMRRNPRPRTSRSQ